MTWSGDGQMRRAAETVVVEAGQALTETETEEGRALAHCAISPNHARTPPPSPSLHAALDLLWPGLAPRPAANHRRGLWLAVSNLVARLRTSEECEAREFRASVERCRG